MAGVQGILIARAVLARIFTNGRDLQSFEKQQEIVDGAPDLIRIAQETATDAQTKTNDIKANVRFLVTQLTGSLSQERKLAWAAGSGGSVNDLGAGNDFELDLDVAANLGYTPYNAANFNGDFDTRLASALAGDVTIGGTVEADHLRVNETATASGAVTTHTVPININGTVMYLLVSSVP